MESLSSTVCRSCRQQIRALSKPRTFSTTSARCIVPPESPAFVDVPSSHQPDLPYVRPQKGLLPVPREIFPARRPDKPSREYIANVTRDPLSHNVKPIESLTKLGQHRARMSELRKKHLREGLTELYRRKKDTTLENEYRSRNKQTERARLIEQPEREDSRLTSSTVPEVMKGLKSATPIADDLAAAKALYETKKANYERTIAAKQEQRLDALHTLYMNARTFITTPEQLDAAITHQFDTQKFLADHAEGRSMWNMGPPDTIKDMINNAKGAAEGAESMLDMGRPNKQQDRMAEQAYLKDQERMKKIAEKLSGGKI